MNKIPISVILNIYGYLDLDDLISLSKVSAKFQKIYNRNILNGKSVESNNLGKGNFFSLVYSFSKYIKCDEKFTKYQLLAYIILGEIESFKSLYIPGAYPTFSYLYVKESCRYDRYEIVEFLLMNEIDPRYALEYGSKFSRNNVIELSLKYEASNKQKSLLKVAKKGNLNTFKFLLRVSGTEINDLAFREASLNKDDSILKYLKETFPRNIMLKY